jgi:FkbM family methyltransferase
MVGAELTRKLVGLVSGRNRGRRPETVVLRGLPIRFAVIEGDSGDQLRNGYESEVLDFIDSLPTDSVLYDIGASIGHFALYAAARGITTVAFEPDPANCGALEANARANRSRNLTTLPIAISDHGDGTAVLRTDSNKPRVGDHHKVLDVSDFSGHEEIALHLDRRVSVRAMSLDAAIDAYASVVGSIEDAGLQATGKHQVYSGIGIEEGLFNIRFDRPSNARPAETRG